MNEEMFKKLKDAKSAEEMIAIAKEYGKEMTKEEAEEILAFSGAQGELDDDALDSVAGGMNIPSWLKSYGPNAVNLMKFLF